MRLHQRHMTISIPVFGTSHWLCCIYLWFESYGFNKYSFSLTEKKGTDKFADTNIYECNKSFFDSFSFFLTRHRQNKCVNFHSEIFHSSRNLFFVYVFFMFVLTYHPSSYPQSHSCLFYFLKLLCVVFLLPNFLLVAEFWHCVTLEGLELRYVIELFLRLESISGIKD